MYDKYNCTIISNYVVLSKYRNCRQGVLLDSSKVLLVSFILTLGIRLSAVNHYSIYNFLSEQALTVPLCPDN